MVRSPPWDSHDSDDDDYIYDETYSPNEHSVESDPEADEYHTVPTNENNCSSEDDCRVAPGKIRQYRFKRRKKRNKSTVSALRSGRYAEAERKENPFLIQRVCCATRRCFDQVDTHYAFEQYKNILRMDLHNLRAKQQSMLDTTTMEFYFNGRPVCYRFLSLGLKFSFYMVSNVKGTQRSRTPPGTVPRENNKMSQRYSIVVFLRNYAN